MTKLTQDRSRQNAVGMLPLLIVLLAFALRVWRLDAQSLTGDEAFSLLNWTRVSIEWLLTKIALIDPQPPVALLSLYGWVQLVGDTVFAARMLSVLFGTIAVAACYVIAAQLFGRQIALAAALTATLNPFLISHAQDLRSYGLWIGLSALTLATLIRAFRRPAIRNWALYCVLAALSAYTYYLEAFLLIVHNIYALIQISIRRTHAPKWILSQCLIALTLAPWFLQPALRQSGYQPTAGAPDIIGAFQAFLLGTTLPSEIRSAIPIVVTLLLTLSLLASFVLPAVSHSIQDHPLTSKLLILAAAFVPVIALSLLAWVTGKGYFHPRYVAGSAIPTIILISYLINPAEGKALLRRLGWALIVTVWALSIVSYLGYRFDARLAKAPQWPTVVELLDQQAAQGDLILQNYPDPAFTYYYSGSIESQTLPEEENAPSEQTLAHLEAYTVEHDYIWFMPVESDAFDRDRVVATWLENNLQLISEQSVSGVRILQYANWDRSHPDITLSPTPDFDNVVRLHGYSLTPPTTSFSRGDMIYVELFWKPLRKAAASLKFYVHLIGPNAINGSPLWGQDDHYPQLGRLDSTSWTTNAIFPDVYQVQVPPDAPSGQYSLTVGVYDPATNQRLVLSGDANPIDANSVTLMSFTLP